MLARDFVSWHLGLEDLAVWAMDIDSEKRAASSGERAPTKAVAGLEYYLGRKLYDPREDLFRVECSATEVVTGKLEAVTLSASLGNVVNRWLRDADTRGLRVPVLLRLGHCCKALSLGRGVKRTEHDTGVTDFIRAFREYVTNLDGDPDLDPQPFVDEDLLHDWSVDPLDENTAAFGSCRYGGSYVDNALIPSATPFDIGIKHALLVVARIGLLPPIAPGGPRVPHVLTLLLANGYGYLRMALASDHAGDVGRPRGYSDRGLPRVSQLEMRTALLSRLGRCNVVVGFHVSWTLTALELVLPGSRVIDLGTEECFQKFCRDLARPHPSWTDFLPEHLALAYDRRLPAALLKPPLELYSAGVDDPFAEMVYLMGLWNTLGHVIADHRRHHSVHRRKMLVPVGVGPGLCETEVELLDNDYSLVARPRDTPVASMVANEVDFFSMLEHNDLTVEKPTWPGDHQALFKRCHDMVQEWQPHLQILPLSRVDFGDHEDRRPLAITMALPSRAVRGHPGTLISWINHHDDMPIAELYHAASRLRARSNLARCIVTTCLDLAFYPAMLDYVCNPDPNAPEPEAPPANPFAAKVSVARSSGANPRAPGEPSHPTAPQTPTQQHQPVSLTPVAPFLPPVLDAPQPGDLRFARIQRPSWIQPTFSTAASSVLFASTASAAASTPLVPTSAAACSTPSTSPAANPILSASSTPSTSATLTSPSSRPAASNSPQESDDEPEPLAIAPPPQTPPPQSLDDSNNSAGQGVKTRSQCARDASQS
jgi:hypothetical protein